MKHTITVYGMHCKACELLLHQSLEEIPWCSVESLSHKTGKIHVHYTWNDLTPLHEAITQAGYTTTPPTTTTHSPEEKADAIISKLAWLLVAGVLVRFIMQTNVARLMPSYETLTFGIALIVWLVASLSTCLAVTGGIVIGYAESVQTHHNWRTQVTFHLGRLLAFVVGGALLGAIGGQFDGSVRFNGIFSIIVGIVLLYLGAQLLGFVPNITQRWFHLPSWLSKWIFALKHPRYAPWVGALTFLLPCWFTQSMQLVALQSGSLLQGAMIMGAFALGTLPVLFALGIGVKLIKDKVRLLNPLIAALLVAFGMYTIVNGYTLINILKSSSVSTAPQPPVVQWDLELVTYAIGHNGYAFVPEDIELAVGKNYKLIVTPTSNGKGCFTHVVLPGIGAQPIRQGESFEILVDGSTAKRIPLVCASMGMSMGQIVVK